MYKILILIVLVANFAMGQDPIYHDVNVDFKNGEQYALFGDDVKFRKSPDVKSQVIALLKIGTAVEIIEKTSKNMLYNGMESSFYKVSYQGKTGYILGGLISLEKKESQSKTYLFAFKKKEFGYNVLVRTLSNDGQFAEIETPLGPTSFSVDLYDNKGITGVINVLHIDNRPESCGIVGGEIYFFQTNKQLIKAIHTTTFSDAGVNWFGEELTFPTDEGGVADRIVYEKEQGEYGDEASNEVHSSKTSRHLRWENGEILPKIEEEQ